MIIKYRNFEIKVCEESYDLYHYRAPKKKPSHKNVGEEVKVCLGYFTGFDRMLQKIVQVELSTKEEIVDLRSFMELYGNILAEFKDALNERFGNDDSSYK